MNWLLPFTQAEQFRKQATSELRAEVEQLKLEKEKIMDKMKFVMAGNRSAKATMMALQEVYV